MKALTIHQPWIHLLLAGVKQYETRSWTPPKNYTGKILLCAGASQKYKKDWFAVQRKFYLEQFYETAWHELPRGYALAIANLTHCEEMTEDIIAEQSDLELVCGLWQPGNYIWHFDEVNAIAPFPVKGQQKLFEADISGMEVQ